MSLETELICSFSNLPGMEMLLFWEGGDFKNALKPIGMRDLGEVTTELGGLKIAFGGSVFACGDS